MQLYNKIRSFLSLKNQGRLTRLLVYIGIKPSVNRKAKSPFQKGVLIFSADFEMAWAFRYSRTKKDVAVHLGLQERTNFPMLFQLFNKYNIPVTWATVGHLFLSECERDKAGNAHPGMPRPSYFLNRNWEILSGDWYDHDPSSNVSSDPAWYAPDLIHQILTSATPHEIGCHTFSHIDFTYKNCPKTLAEAEIDECVRLANEKSIKLQSMVFPGGTAGNFETLKEKGFTCYRQPMKHHIDLPYTDKHGLIAVPSSLGLDKDPYGWSKEFHLKMIRSFIRKAIKYKLVCHFWFHPSMSPWYLENVMPYIIELASSLRDEGTLDILTMGQLAERSDLIK